MKNLIYFLKILFLVIFIILMLTIGVIMGDLSQPTISAKEPLNITSFISFALSCLAFGTLVYFITKKLEAKVKKEVKLF